MRTCFNLLAISKLKINESFKFFYMKKRKFKYCLKNEFTYFNHGMDCLGYKINRYFWKHKVLL